MSRTKPQIFYASKSRGETKVSRLLFFRHYATFSRKYFNSIKRYPLEFFEISGLEKTFIEPEGSLFRLFGNMRLFLPYTFLIFFICF